MNIENLFIIDDSIRIKDLDIPDTLQGKADSAFSYIKMEGAKMSKPKKSFFRRPAFVAVCAAIVVLAAGTAFAAANNFWMSTYEGTLKEEIELNDMECWTVEGEFYKGYLLKIPDPSRVFLGTVNEFDEDTGMSVAEMIRSYGAVAGINGGQHAEDTATSGTGMPAGAVISQGEVVYDEFGGEHKYDIIGFNDSDELIVGSYTIAEAIEEGIRDAVSYDGTISSELVINGKKAIKSGGGINPQTAIGQCEDGTVLLLVIDGRQENSLGASKSDVADIMLECGAVNAVSMVGGSYTAMNVADESVNSSFRVDGAAVCPDAWLVK